MNKFNIWPARGMSDYDAEDKKIYLTVYIPKDKEEFTQTYMSFIFNKPPKDAHAVTIRLGSDKPNCIGVCIFEPGYLCEEVIAHEAFHVACAFLKVVDRKVLHNFNETTEEIIATLTGLVTQKICDGLGKLLGE